MSYSAWSVIAGETPTATKWNILGSNDADFDTRLTQLLADNTVHQATDGATITLDLSVSRLWEVTLAGNRTLAFSNVSTKRPFGLFVKQDATGNRTLDFPSGIAWPGGSEPVITPTANLCDLYVFVPKYGWVASSNEVYWGLYGGFGMS